MAIKTSTGLRNQMLDTNPLKTVFNLGFLKIYAGAVPADADASIGSATLLCTVSVNSTGTGITFASTASGGTIVKNSGEVWSGVNVATGTATFYRLVAAGDTGASSTTEARVQGTVATSGADLNLTSTSLTSAATQSIDYYSLTLPTA
jgi:hypothetical protein